jgi:8-oxo-dGTP pyrophosphatase MutT (NUDIX family)
MFVAVYLLLLREGRVLLLRRHNTGYEDGNYSVIAGHVERDERITHALVREAAEEAGIRLSASDLQFVHVMQRKGADGLVYVDFFFLTEQWEGQVQNSEPARCDDLQWFPTAEIPANTIPYVREVLGMLHSQREGFREYGWGG